jgi:hypothetical protein
MVTGVTDTVISFAFIRRHPVTYFLPQSREAESRFRRARRPTPTPSSLPSCASHGAMSDIHNTRVDRQTSFSSDFEIAILFTYHLTFIGGRSSLTKWF